MRGKILCRQTCPICGARGQFNLVPGTKVMVCACGKFPASRYDIVIWWRGKARWILHDQKGRRFITYAEAETALGVINSQIKDRAFYPEAWGSAQANLFLWENYLKAYLDRERDRLLPERRATYEKKRALVARLSAAFPGQNIREIRSGHVMDWINSPALRTELSPKTRADLAVELRHIFREAVARDEIERAPRVPSVPVPEAEIRWLAPQDQEAALAKIHPHHRPIFAFLFTYGCRVAEACALCWDKIDRRTETFSLARTFSRRRLVDKPKTKRPNVLPIVAEFAAYLDASPRGLRDMPVFINPEADRRRNPRGFYIPDFLNRVWKAAIDEAGLEPIPLKNATRHSRGMQAVNLEHWSLEEVRRLLGHTSQAHTRKYAEAGVELIRTRLSKTLATQRAKENSPAK